MGGIPGLDRLGAALGGLVGMGGEQSASAPPAAPPPAPARNGLLDVPGGGAEDLSDVGPLRMLALKLGNFSAGATGGPMFTQQLRDQRIQQNQRRTQAFQQAMQLATDFGKVLDTTSHSQLEGRSQMLRQRFAELAGTGGEEMFDSLVGDPGSWFGQTEAAKDDPTLAAMIQDPRTTPAMIKAYMQSEDYRTRAAMIQDQKLIMGDPATGRLGLPARLQAQLDNASPEYRKKFEELEKNGGITWDDVGELQPFASDTMRFTQSDLITGGRNEEAFNGIRSFRTRKQALGLAEKTDESKLGEDRTARRDETLHGYKMEEIREQNKGRINATHQPKPASQANLLTGANKVIAQRQKYAEKKYEIDSVLKLTQNGIADYALLNKFINQLDDTAAREGEVATVRSEAASLSDRIKRTVAGYQTGQGILGPEARKQIEAALTEFSGRWDRLDRDYMRQQVHTWARTQGPDTPDQYFYGWRQLFDPEEQEQLLHGQPSSAPAPAAAGGTTGTVNGDSVSMKFPDGKTKMIPRSKLEEMKKHGGVVQ